jgi:hypothetical protein
MIPGKTTREETIHDIDQLLASGWANYIDKGSWGYSISPLPSSYEGSIQVYFKDDIVNTISGQIRFYYSAETMVKQFGEPEGLYIRESRMTQSSCTDWNPPESPMAPVQGSLVSVIYPNQGVAFYILVPEADLICPEMKVTAFCYYAPISMEAALTDEYLANLCSIVPKPSSRIELVKWHGFGGGY